MSARRDYDGWVAADMLDPAAAGLLAYLDRVAGRGPGSADAVAAHIDGYGVVTSTISLTGAAELYLQVGDGWDRVLWTCPSGRVYEWTWRERETPGDLDALLAGRGVERTAWLRRRRVGAGLVLDGRALARPEGKWRVALLRRVGVRLREREEPAV